MEKSEDLSNAAAQIVAGHYLVAQATGVLAVQSKLSVDAAFEKLKADAAAQGRPITDVAGEIVQNCELSARGSASR